MAAFFRGGGGGFLAWRPFFSFSRALGPFLWNPRSNTGPSSAHMSYQLAVAGTGVWSMLWFLLGLLSGGWKSSIILLIGTVSGKQFFSSSPGMFSRRLDRQASKFDNPIFQLSPEFRATLTRDHPSCKTPIIIYSSQWEIKVVVQPYTLKHNPKLELYIESW